jgi:hypothetical protein
MGDRHRRSDAGLNWSIAVDRGHVALAPHDLWTRNPGWPLDIARPIFRKPREQPIALRGLQAAKLQHMSNEFVIQSRALGDRPTADAGRLHEGFGNELERFDGEHAARYCG